MITIKLNSEAYAHKDTIIKCLEDEIDELRLYYDYEIIEDDDLWHRCDVEVVSKLADRDMDVYILLIKIRDTLYDFLAWYKIFDKE